MKTAVFTILGLTILSAIVFAQPVTSLAGAGSFPIAAAGKVASIYIDGGVPELLRIAAGLLGKDIAALTGLTPQTINTPEGNTVIILGTVSQSETLKKPLPGLERALV